MKRTYYTSPEIEILEVMMEGGFSLSGVVDGGDYGDGGEGSEME
jgi:hypothetical protein